MLKPDAEIKYNELKVKNLGFCPFIDKDCESGCVFYVPPILYDKSDGKEDKYWDAREGYCLRVRREPK